MPKKKNACFDEVRLADFLQERLSEADESSMVSHLDECAECQHSLEKVAADGSVWSSLKSHFRKAADDTWESAKTDRNEQILDSVKDCLGPTDDPSMLGRLGQYEVCGVVGRGSAGIVLKALETRLNRYVAIKILAPNFASNGSARIRFEREARAIAAVAHEHVVPIFSVNEFRNLPYLVMQFAAGGSLQQRIDKEGPLETDEVVRVGMQVASGLAAAHEQGIVHRDVKPANVMLESGVERAMVTDFGLARVLNDASLTHSGVITGTPQFMSPEQAKGDYVDHRTDLFSLGSLMYAASTGRPPFRSETVYGVIRRVCETDIRPIREINPNIPEWLELFIEKLCAKDREERFQTAAEVRDFLSQELAHLQSPLAVAQPERKWIPKPLKQVSSSIATRPQVLVGAVALMFVLVMAALSMAPTVRNAFFGGSDSVRETNQLSRAAILKLPVFESTLTRALPVEHGGRLKLHAGYADVKILPSESQQLDIRVVRRVSAASREEANVFLAKHRLKLKFDDSGLVADMRLEDCSSEDLMRYGEFEVRVFVPAGFHTDITKLQAWSQLSHQGESG